MDLDREFIAVRVTAHIATKIARLNMRNVPMKETSQTFHKSLSILACGACCLFSFLKKTSGACCHVCLLITIYMALLSSSILDFVVSRWIKGILLKP